MSSDGGEKLYKNFGNFLKENFRSEICNKKMYDSTKLRLNILQTLEKVITHSEIGAFCVPFFQEFHNVFVALLCVFPKLERKTGIHTHSSTKINPLKQRGQDADHDSTVRCGGQSVMELTVRGHERVEALGIICQSFDQVALLLS